MPVRVLIAVVIVLFAACLLFAADRTVKAIQRGRRRREANLRLAAAAAQAEANDRQRKAAEQVGGALTSVMPTIHDVDTRLVGRHDEAPPAGRHDEAPPADQQGGAPDPP
jgi:type II secretory pathway pseudopilin PulG